MDTADFASLPLSTTTEILHTLVGNGTSAALADNAT